jgi:hypothetical protein
VLGDVNRDGTPDVVTANSGARSVSVLLGTGDGGVAAKVDYALGSFAAAIALGDLNNDGYLDIVTNAGGGVLLGAGNGSFAAATADTSGIGGVSLALGDVNGDGKLDVATANGPAGYEVKGTVSVRLGKGDGTFATNVDYAAGFGPHALALGDLNGDHKLDIVVVNNGYGDGGWSVSVLLGKGDGTFADQVSYDSGLFPNMVALGDLNGDSKLDIIMANSGASPVSVLLGRGDGTFAEKVDLPFNGGGQALALGDVDGDRKLDIVMASSSSASLYMLLGNGNGSFSSEVAYYTLRADSAALGDLNGDARLDVVIVDSTSSSVRVLLNSCP